MRRNRLTLSLMAALLLSACAPNTQTDAPDTVVQIPVSASSESDTRETESSNTLTVKTPAADTVSAELPERFEGLSPFEITRAEIAELILLEAKQSEASKISRAAFNAWRDQDPSQRGPRPDIAPSSFPPKDKARLSVLNGKLKNAEIRKKYESADSTALTAAELQELIQLEQTQSKLFTEFQTKVEAWLEQDPATRGPQPELDASSLGGVDPRFLELQAKFENADNIERMVNRVEEMSATYNISLSDSEISELAELETEQAKFQREFARVMSEAEKQSALTGVELSQEEVIKNFPKDLIRRMMDMELRKQEIMAPLEAAKKADRIQTRLTELSEVSGIPILSGEISESIELNAEKDKIKDRSEKVAIQKWLWEDGPIYYGTPLPNDEDYARLKEIDARLKAISAPMMDAKNAALEADNPALRQERLAQEAAAKWRSDWRDQQQAGTVPPGTPMTSPSYAEIKDRVTDYGTKLKDRADKVGFAVPETDIARLDALNTEMLAIRKTVYDMERDGSSQIKGRGLYKSRTLKVSTNMYKIRLIERKQREILEGLSNAESLQNEAFNSEALSKNPENSSFEQYQEGSGHMSVDGLIKDYKARGADISQSDIDDIRAFEQELAGR